MVFSCFSLLLVKGVVLGVVRFFGVGEGLTGSLYWRFVLFWVGESVERVYDR